MVDRAALDIVAALNLLAALITLFFCFRNIYIHLLRQRINKKFINMFYIVAILILISILGMSFGIFLKLPENYIIEKDEESLGE